MEVDLFTLTNLSNGAQWVNIAGFCGAGDSDNGKHFDLIGF
ncbi:Uncharacterised protein [Vibrio cholerae]|uniref:Uncharacterized protein n=1 Tax=Vibrio cholerae TaxID=666 RepID=A0A655RPC8_VIBCL|nr:Uncharacterised protein [Vibrio cholerae]CSD26424.1 Uncharacterised protein [Vibrio cholerae]